ncbi:MAG: DUF4197 domain-containing protein [Fibrobacteres bacterium]|nr:DUF4197 domain-containing protein [Fibrobacterota bacterium]
MGMRNPARIALAFSAALLAACNLQDVLDTGGQGNGYTEGQVVNGLRTALSVGIDSSANLAGKVDGYLANAAIKILLPEEAAQALASARSIGAYVSPFARQLQSVQSAASLIGLDNGSIATNLSRASALAGAAASLQTLGDSVVKYMNRAAEKAAPRSVPIFKSAITSLTISDGLSLLDSPDSTAATLFLRGHTFEPLTNAYAPLVDSTLALVPLTQYWGTFRTAYNTLLGDYQTLLAFQTTWNADAAEVGLTSYQINSLQPVSNKTIQTESLGAWTTKNALTGLFLLVGNQEKDIRRDPFGYVKNLAFEAADILKQVFGEIMQMGTNPGATNPGP